KYFYAKSCQNWVYVNGEACITCLVSFSPSYILPLLSLSDSLAFRLETGVVTPHVGCQGRMRTGRRKANGIQAEGCEALEDDVRSFSPDVCVPVWRDGMLEYALVSRDGLGLVDGPGEGVL